MVLSHPINKCFLIVGLIINLSLNVHLLAREEGSYFDAEKMEKGKSKKEENINNQNNQDTQYTKPVELKKVPVKENADANPKIDVTDSSDEGPFLFTGFFRQTLHGSQSTLPREKRIRKELLSSYSRLRLEASWKDEEEVWRAQASGNADFIFSNYMDSPEFDLYWKTRIRNRLFSMENINDEDEYLIRSDVHRLWVSWAAEDLDLKFGRQVLSWGQGRFINPMDLITPSGPFITDIEDIPGADIASAVYSINSFDMIEIVVAPYKRLDNTDLGKLENRDANALARYKATYDNLDYSVLAGYHFHSHVFGTELTLTHWDANFRMSWLARDEGKLADLPYYDAENLPAQTTHQGTIGVSYAFWGKLRTNLEFLLNSAYYKKDLALQSHLEQELAVRNRFTRADSVDSSFFRTEGRIFTKNPYLIQFSLSYDLDELWSLGFMTIADKEGESIFLSPTITYSFSDEGVWALGAWLFEDYGYPGEGEFENLPPSVYTYIRIHF